MMNTKKMYVTVGSTKFDDLISAVCDLNCLKELVHQGYTHVTLQIGRGRMSRETFINLCDSNLDDEEVNRLYISSQADLDCGKIVTLRNASLCQKPRELTVTLYRFTTGFIEDVRLSHMVVSHAGAGTCLEVLSVPRPLITVTNDSLMDRHQSELADMLSAMGVTAACVPATLEQTLREVNVTALAQYTPGQPQLLSLYLAKKFVVQH